MNPPDAPLLHWLLRTTIEGGTLIVLVLALRRAFPRQFTPGWRVALWAMVGVKLLVPASLPIGVGFGNMLAVEAAPVPAGSVSAGELVRHGPADEAGGEGVPAPWAARFESPAILASVWGAGFAAVFALLLAREVRFRRSLARLRGCDDRALLSLVRECAARCGTKSVPPVRMLPEGCGPAIAGLFSPVLLLPADWRVRFDDDALRHVIFHELEHVSSRDLLWNWIAALVTTVHWFNPLAWLAASRFQADRELRCDARALGRMEPAERAAYGRTLLRISESFLAPPATAGLAPCVRKHPTLRQRITMITRPPTSSPILQVCSAGVLGLLACLSFGSARAQEEPGKDRAPESRLSRQLGDPKPAGREAGKAREAERPRDGERPREGARDGERRREGPRDGDQPRTGPRDGDVPRTGERDGDRPRTGPRDEGGPKPEGGRGRDGAKSREGERGRDEVREGGRGEPLEVHVMGQGDDVKIAGEVVPMHRLRGFLQGYLADKKGRPVSIDADPSTPYSAVATVLDAVRDNGARNVQIRAVRERER